MAQVQDVIRASMRSIGALASGDPLDTTIANDALFILNEMVDEWSNDRIAVPAQYEIIHELTPNQFVYTIGPGGSVGGTFLGYIAPDPNGTGGILTVSAISSGAIHVGQVISGGSILGNTTITSYGTGIGGNTTAALGTYYVQFSQTVGTSLAQITITGAARRPVRINTAFVRVVNSATGYLDFPVEVIAADQYAEIGIKTLPCPWPNRVYYQPSSPLGVLNYYPNPQQGEMHLFEEVVVAQFSTLNDYLVIAPGVQAALHWNLAVKLMPEFGKMEQGQVQMVMEQANLTKGLLRRSARNPQSPVKFDGSLASSAHNDAGFFLHGGFA